MHVKCTSIVVKEMWKRVTGCFTEAKARQWWCFAVWQAWARVCLPAGSDVYVPGLTKTQSDFKDPAGFFISHICSFNSVEWPQEKLLKSTFLGMYLRSLYHCHGQFKYNYLPYTAHFGPSEETVYKRRWFEFNLDMNLQCCMVKRKRFWVCSELIAGSWTNLEEEASV